MSVQKFIVPVGTNISLYSGDTTFLGGATTTHECVYNQTEMDNVEEFYNIRNMILPTGTQESTAETIQKQKEKFFCVRFQPPFLYSGPVRGLTNSPPTTMVSWYFVDKKAVLVQRN